MAAVSHLYKRVCPDVIVLSMTPGGRGLHSKDEYLRVEELVAGVLEQEGLYVDVVSTQNQNVHYGSNSPETPVLQARTAYDVKKNTAMIYAYLDVYPAKKSDGWDTEPFMPEEKHGKVYGRGCAAGKGPLVAWLWVLKAFNLAGVPLPVNLRFVIDSTREIGSKAATVYIESKMNRYFYYSTHSVVLSDGSWLEENRPSISCALRGLCYFEIDVTCAGHDLHSGVYGGTISEGMSDVISLLNSLTDEDGCISVPGFCDQVADLTDDEKWTLINARVDMVWNCTESESCWCCGVRKENTETS
ncbi:hypothetical protein HPB50_025525 [Hyalomma asiaticum]|uniref:Uncharacterized protein n=1 Tax=Hyalomma asiaticum TaxID=266040 RepID=A0ACB7SWR4_HYAAI|nr:hypothetical protein HPB50_025525 [Hyalomma asiaticum]